ncbi:MAG: hypothetical protein ACRC46_04375 [Thermoguttaceae bacterium]
MTATSHALSPSPTFPIIDDELADDFVDDVDDFDGDDEVSAFIRSRMIQNEDGEWVYQLTERQLAAVEQSRQDIAAGRVHSHEDVMAETFAWLERNR